MKRIKVFSLILVLLLVCSLGLAACKAGMDAKKAMEFVRDTIKTGSDLKNSIEYDYAITKYAPVEGGEEGLYQKKSVVSVHYTINRVKVDDAINYYIYGSRSETVYTITTAEDGSQSISEKVTGKLEAEYFPSDNGTEIRVGLSVYDSEGKVNTTSTKVMSEKPVLEYRNMILNTVVLCESDEIINGTANFEDPTLIEEGTRNFLMMDLYVPKMLPTVETEILPDEQERSPGFSASIIFKNSTSEILKNEPVITTYVSRSMKATYLLSYAISTVNVENLRYTDNDEYFDIAIQFNYSDTKEALSHKIEA